MISSKPRSFDRVEIDDVIMFRFLVEYHLSNVLTAKLCILFGHRNKFKAFPGPVVFLMALDICNASVAQDIEGAKTSSYALRLLSYSEEIVTECVTEAQRLVNILQMGMLCQYQLAPCFSTSSQVHPVNSSIAQSIICKTK